MALEDKDFILRQVKTLAKGLGMLLSKESLKELINYQASEEESLSDEVIQQIILLADVQRQGELLNMTPVQLAQELGMEPTRWLDLIKGDALPTPAEADCLLHFLTRSHP